MPTPIGDPTVLETEIKFLLYVVSGLLGIFSFVVLNLIRYILELGKKINSIQTHNAVCEEKHVATTKAFGFHHERIKTVEDAVFIKR